MNHLTPEELAAQLIPLGPPAFLNRYLSAVAVASVLYDHIRTLDTEVSDVWTSLRTSRGIKIGFLVGRYAADAALLYSAYALSGGATNLTPLGCKFWLATFWVAEAGCTATTQGIVIYRLKEIWGGKKYPLQLIPVILFCVSVVMIVLEIPLFFRTLQYIDPWHTCATQPLKPIYTIVQYSSLALTDIIVILLFIIAVLEIPYRHSTEVIVKLERDGGWYFLALFVIHVGCILVLAFGKNYFPVALPLVWAFTMIINSRIFHRIGIDKKNADKQKRYLSGGQLVWFD